MILKLLLLSFNWRYLSILNFFILSIFCFFKKTFEPFSDTFLIMDSRRQKDIGSKPLKNGSRLDKPDTSSSSTSGFTGRRRRTTLYVCAEYRRCLCTKTFIDFENDVSQGGEQLLFTQLYPLASIKKLDYDRVILVTGKGSALHLIDSNIVIMFDTELNVVEDATISRTKEMVSVRPGTFGDKKVYIGNSFMRASADIIKADEQLNALFSDLLANDDMHGAGFGFKTRPTDKPDHKPITLSDSSHVSVDTDLTATGAAISTNGKCVAVAEDSFQGFGPDLKGLSSFYALV